MRQCRYYMLQFATDIADVSERQLKDNERNKVLPHEKYRSDYYTSDEELKVARLSMLVKQHNAESHVKKI